MLKAQANMKRSSMVRLPSWSSEASKSLSMIAMSRLNSLTSLMTTSNSNFTSMRWSNSTGVSQSENNGDDNVNHHDVDDIDDDRSDDDE